MSEKYRAGQRLKAVRELAGLQPEEFAELLKMNYMRLCNIEYLRSKMNERDFYEIVQTLPEFLLFIIAEKPISLAEVLKSDSQLVLMIGYRISQGLQPKVFNIDEFIV